MVISSVQTVNGHSLNSVDNHYFSYLLRFHALLDTLDLHKDTLNQSWKMEDGQFFHNLLSVLGYKKDKISLQTPTFPRKELPKFPIFPIIPSTSM